MGFDIEDVGEDIKQVFKGKQGKVLMIGGGILVVGAVVLFMKKGRQETGAVSFSEYPIAPTADLAPAEAGNTTADQLAETFSDSLSNMNTDFTELLTAQQNSFQTQIDAINMSNAESFNTLNDNFADTVGTISKSAADVSTSLTDFANSRALTIEAVQPNEDGYGYGGADYSIASAGVREKMVSDVKKIQSGDKAFIESDLARTDGVIAQRKKAGLDISAQLKHRKTLEIAAAK